MQVKFIFFLLFILLSQMGTAQQNALGLPSPKPSVAHISFFDTVIADSIFEINLSADFSSLRANKYKEEYYPARLFFNGTDGEEHIFKASIKTRGKSRKKLCYHPSMKLKFKKKELKRMGLNADNKYKMVCQCKSGKTGQQTLLREYLAYQLYNLITENSFKVHLFQINYIDNETSEAEKRYGFLLESKEGLEKRLKGEIISREKLIFENISREAKLQMALFQYMIANTDWDIPAMHNIKLLQNEKTQQLIPIPYDYDYSGLVYAPYATPNPDYPIKTVTERYFQILDCSEEEILRQLEQFQKQKTSILNLIDNFDFINGSSKRFTRRFLLRFFKIIENPKRVLREFVKG